MDLIRYAYDKSLPQGIKLHSYNDECTAYEAALNHGSFLRAGMGC
jgi:hypothetical protein